MKAIIVAAGIGSRIAKDIGEIPKSTVLLSDGTPLIRRNVMLLLDRGIEVVICVGYKKELIYKALKGLDVKYYFNPFYRITNNVGSLWFAREELDDDILLLSGDLYFPAKFIDSLTSTNNTIAMIADSSRVNDGDFYLSVNDHGNVVKYGPQIPLENRKFEYMGISKISQSFVTVFKNRLINYIETEKYTMYFEDILLSFSVNHEERIEFIDVSGEFWREFDIYEDYLKILNFEKEESNAE